MPKTHILKVRTGMFGSSVVGTVRATCSIGEFSDSGETPEEISAPESIDDEVEGLPS